MEMQLDGWFQAGVTYLPRLIGALVIFIGLWMVGTIIKKLVFRLAQVAGPGKRDVLDILAQSVKVIFLVIATISALGTLGIDMSGIIAGLGLTGFALGFALKDVLSNVISGMLVLLYRPFSRGDRIAVSGFEGFVVSIDLRYTTLESENSKILIPNASLFSNSVVVQENQNKRGP
jgi:small conductance mechanosensitive channel